MPTNSGYPVSVKKLATFTIISLIEFLSVKFLVSLEKDFATELVMDRPRLEVQVNRLVTSHLCGNYGSICLLLRRFSHLRGGHCHCVSH